MAKFWKIDSLHSIELKSEFLRELFSSRTAARLDLLPNNPGIILDPDDVCEKETFEVPEGPFKILNKFIT